MENTIREDFIKDVLNKCHIVFENFDQLDNILIPRDTLLSQNIYENTKDQIPKLKKLFCSSSMTSLHSKAEDNQKWPLLNLVRQILKSCDYNMVPIRKSDGYTVDKKKKYKRFFRIEKLKSVQ